MNDTARRTIIIDQVNTSELEISMPNSKASLLIRMMKLLRNDYTTLSNALNNDDYETIWRMGRTLVGRGQSFGFQSFIKIGNLLELEAQSQNKNELSFLIDGFPAFIKSCQGSTVNGN